MEKTKGKNNKAAAIIFLILMIAALVGTVSTLTSGVVVTGLTVYGFKSAKKMLNSFNQPAVSAPQPAGDKVAFKNDRLDLGLRSDGCYYSIIRMVDGTGYPMDDGEFVVLKKSGTNPVVQYYSYNAEAGQRSAYLISYGLYTDDFSDMIDIVTVANHPEIFQDKTNLEFKIIDLDNDIIKTPLDYQNEKDAALGDVFVRILGYIIVLIVCILGAILAGIQFLTALPVFAAFIVFLILFLVFLSKARKDSLPEKVWD